MKDFDLPIIDCSLTAKDFTRAIVDTVVVNICLFEK